MPSSSVCNICSIKRDGFPIEPSMLNVLPGEFINLNLDCGATSPTNIQWSIASENHKDYVASSCSGVLTELTQSDLTQASIGFFWGNTGSKTVTVTYRINGVDCSKSVTFTVAVPTWSLSAVQRTVEFRGNQYEYGLLKDDPTDWYGIRFTASVTLPQGMIAGDFALFQLGKQTIRRKFSNNTCTHKTTGSSYCFDDNQTFPSGGPWTTGNVGTWDDAPQSTLLTPSLTNHTRDDQFVTYLMFKPSGGKWVALAKFSWWWKGCVELQSGIWQFVSRSQGKDLSATATTTAPTWNCALDPTGSYSSITCPTPFCI